MNNTEINSQQTPITQRSYNSVVSTTMFPKKEQAIILNASGDLQLIDYVKTIGTIIGPQNITFASKMSNGRYCLYLKNKQLVDNVTDQYKTIKIKNYDVGIRKLISPAKRIILSNVCPSIPHATIENKLKSIGIKLASPVNFLRASIQDEEYKHILSFRRQVYSTCSPSEELSLPSSIIVEHEETEYRIFLSLDEVKCFLCSQTGHTATKCTNKPIETTNPPTNTGELNQNHKRPATSSTTDTEKNEVEQPTETNLEAEPKIFTDTELPKASHSMDNKFVQPLSAKHTPKRKKTLSENYRELPTNYDSSLLEPAREHIEQHKELFPLNFQEFRSLMQNVKGSADTLSTVNSYTPDTSNLINMIRSVVPFLKDKSTKSSCTKLANKLARLTKHMGGYSHSEESDSMSSSQEY